MKWQEETVIGVVGTLLCVGCGDPTATATEDVTESRGAELPIVLVHAFHATTSNSWSMENVRDALEEDGHEVYLASIPRYAGTPERAEALATEIDRARERHCETRGGNLTTCLEETRVHLIGHSQGGLDARYVVSRLGYGPFTASVTTIGSPHRGTPLGDVGLSLMGDDRGDREINKLLEIALDNMLTKLLIDAVTPEGLADAFYWLSEARYARSADPTAPEHMPDVPGVYYASVAGVATSDGDLPDTSVCGQAQDFPLGRAGEFHGIIDAERFGLVKKIFDAEHRPYDGHIPVASAQYGEFLGCVPGDHLDLIGRPDGQVDGNIDRAGWDYRHFYRALGHHLARIERADGAPR